MKHPYDNLQLKFQQLKQMIQLLFSGEISQYGQITQKIDGLHMMVTFKDGKILAARNKQHVKNSAQQALQIKDIPKFFDEHDQDVIKNFTLPMIDLKNLFSIISQQKLQQIFWNGRRFISLQLVWQQLVNVVNYFTSVIVFHSVISFDQQGNQLQHDRQLAIRLAKQLKKINKQKNKTQIFDIKQVTPIKIEIQNYQQRYKFYNNKIDEILSQYNIGDIDTIQDYLTKRYQIFVQELQQKFGITFDDQFKYILVYRWGRGDKQFDLRKIKKVLEEQYNEQILQFVTEFQKNDNKAKKDRQYLYPIQLIILQLGIQILNWVSKNQQILSQNPQKTRQNIINDTQQIIKYINQLDKKDPDNIHKINLAVRHANVIDDLGGLKNVTSLQGVVINYKGILYKIVGIYQPINQLLGIIKFDR